MNRTTANYECLMNKEHEACQVYLDCLSKCIRVRFVFLYSLPEANIVSNWNAEQFKFKKQF